MQYEAPMIEDFGSIADHTFAPKKWPPGNSGNTGNFPLAEFPHGSAPS